MIKQIIVNTMYIKYFLLRAIPNFPIFRDITLSSIELKPRKLLFLTTFKHLGHQCIALFVNESTKGKTQNESQPNPRSKISAKRYPSMLVL